MDQTSGTSKDAADKLLKGIKRKTRKQHSAEEKIRIVLAGLRGEESIAALCRREGISESLCYTWSKDFLEAGKQRLAGDTARQATSPEVKELRSETTALKEVVADLTLRKKSAQRVRLRRDGGLMVLPGFQLPFALDFPASRLPYWRAGRHYQPRIG